MTPSSPNPSSTVYAIYQSRGAGQATISTAAGQSQNAPNGVLAEGDIVTVELTERNGIHLVGFIKNGEKMGTPVQLEFQGMGLGGRPRRQGAGAKADRTRWRLLISTSPSGAGFGGVALDTEGTDFAVSLLRREPDSDLSKAAAKTGKNMQAAPSVDGVAQGPGFCP